MSLQRSRTQGLNGLVALAYLGVQPSTPSNFIVKQGAPTPNDYRNVYVGDWWLDNSSMYLSPSVAPTTDNLWLLVSVVGHVATWINFGGGSGSMNNALKDGLVRFKRGFCNDIASSYICGAVLDDNRYAQLIKQREVSEKNDFFPAYRAPKYTLESL